MQNLNLLIKELISLPTETEWLEFKHNNFDPQMIGSDISALANSAAYRGRDKAYMIWGINETHEIVGTNYNRFSKLINNQEIESWLKNIVSKNAAFDFFDTEIDGKKLVVLIIQKATENFEFYYEVLNLFIKSRYINRNNRKRAETIKGILEEAQKELLKEEESNITNITINIK